MLQVERDTFHLYRASVDIQADGDDRRRIISGHGLSQLDVGGVEGNWENHADDVDSADHGAV